MPRPPKTPDPVENIQVLLRPRRLADATNWHLEAVRHVRFLMGQGYRRIAAQQEIAIALNRTIEDMQTWERELVKQDAFENELICTELAGELNEFLTNTHFSAIPDYQIYGSFEGMYNVERASHIARAFRSITLDDIRSGLRPHRR